jgi:hypothetical protein
VANAPGITGRHFFHADFGLEFFKRGVLLPQRGGGVLLPQRVWSIIIIIIICCMVKVSD